MSEELKPCPMCGSSDIEPSGDNGYGAFWVCCNGCGLATSEVGPANQEQANERWNRRAQPAADALTAQAAEIERLRAAALGHETHCMTKAREIEALRADAERYRWLRDTLHKAVGGGVEVNDARLVYEVPEPGESVRVYWYPDTPVGFYESEADTLDAAIDAALVGKAVTP